jgi:hypothetical protein
MYSLLYEKQISWKRNDVKNIQRDVIRISNFKIEVILEVYIKL